VIGDTPAQQRETAPAEQTETTPAQQRETAPAQQRETAPVQQSEIAPVQQTETARPPRPGWHVILVGMMGTGKSTVGRLIAERLGREHLDTDRDVEHAAGRSVSEIFASEGEGAFRLLERRALVAAVAAERPAVISVGGGAVLGAENRRLIARSGQTVWLRARPETLAARLGPGVGRPLLERDPAGTLHGLSAERRDLYSGVARLTVDVDDATPEQIAEEILSALVLEVRVPLGSRSYDVLIGPGARHRLPSLLPAAARRAVIVTQEAVPLGVETGRPTARLELPDGEQAKTFACLERLCREFARMGLTRHDVVIALGGGAVSDVAGFAAACYHRGTAVVHVPTTLLGQVDAAIGGKTAVNIPEGKNLVGAIWQPHGVVCDTDALVTLPAGEWRSGFGEMAKCAFLGVGDLDELPLAEQVRACVALKVDVVASDEREEGRRAVLNYGHTLAHALEAAGLAEGGPRLRHGEAVGIGLVFAARLAQRLGRIDEERVRRHVELVSGYGLPTEPPPGVDHDQLLELMARDKKAAGGEGLTFVLDGPLGVETVVSVDPDVVAEVLSGPGR
jgi:5-deoxy-5-amino-3-dehydroquinate synthase